MATYRVVVNDKSYTVEVPNVNERPVRAIVDGEVIEVQVETAASAPTPMSPSSQPIEAAEPARSTPSPQQTGSGSGTIKAPLPGTIVSVSVSEGERVDEGQELCVLEAMKMNNPIRSTRAGVVEDVLVSPGQQVDHGSPLIVLAGD
jgi:biotin carboxyl carrier protein